MNFSQYAGIAIVPTLSRLVLAAAFLYAGYGKLFTEVDFEATADGTGAANRLHELGVTLGRKNPTITRTSATGHWAISPANLQAAGSEDATRQSPNEDSGVAAAESSNQDQDQPTTEPASGQPQDGEVEDAEDVMQPDVVVTEDIDPLGDQPERTTPPSLSAGTYTALAMHKITLMVDRTGWPFPVWLGRAAAFTEFFGGALILIGLFSRFWGLGLASVMGVAFYLTTLPVLQSTPVLEISTGDFNRLFCQAGLFVLAFGVTLTGAGPLSIDRLLFERREPLPSSPQRK